MCARSLDVGTAFLVKGEVSDAGQPAFTVERNCFLQASPSDDTEQTLKENDWNYAKHQDNYYILGEDAIKLKNLLSVKSDDKSILATQVGDLRRPMKDGVLNTGEEKLSVAIIQKLLTNLVGAPRFQGEVLCFCSPADPVDRNFSVLFHRTMLTNLFKGMGYTVECIPEALAIIFSERPVAEQDGQEQPFTGIAISAGGGMLNVVLCLKKVPLISFSIAQAGDFIDRKAAETSGVPVSVITRFKETKLNLDQVDYSDMKQAALDIYYQATIEHALNIFAEKFNKLETSIDFPLEIVIAGGTSMVPGFLNKFKTVLSTLTLPFKVKDVRMAKEPFYAVSNGCLIKATSVEKKTKQADSLLSNIGEDSKDKSKKAVK